MAETAPSSGVEATSPEDLSARYAPMLASGEKVLMVRQRHWLTFLEAGRWFVASLGAGLLLAALGQSVSDGGISGVLNTLLDWGFWIFLLIGLVGVVWFYFVWRVERYIVTTRRVIEAGGVINKYTRDTALSMITDMIVGHPWLGRLVGYGEIDLLTASEQGTTKIRFLPDPDGFKKVLLDAKYEHELDIGGGRVVHEASAAPSRQASPPSSAAPAHAAVTAEEIEASINRLADMRDRGLITPAEFDAKKKELLDRL